MTGKVQIPQRRAADSINTLLAGTQNLINAHNIYVDKGEGARQANSHLDCVHATAYIWAGYSYVMNLRTKQAELTKVLTLSSISVLPEYRRQGFFLRLLKGLEVMSDDNDRVLRVECVVNEDLDRFLAQRVGYARVGHDPQTFLRSKPK